MLQNPVFHLLPVPSRCELTHSPAANFLKAHLTIILLLQFQSLKFQKSYRFYQLLRWIWQTNGSGPKPNFLNQISNTILCQEKIDVKVTRFGDVVEARTVQHSSIQCLVHKHDLVFSKGADNLIEDCRVGKTTKGKLKRVVSWVQRAGPTLPYVGVQSYKKKQPSINWKVHEETPSQYFFSLSDVLFITDSCKATFFASVGQIFLPITWKNFNESEDERMFIRRRLYTTGDIYLAEDLICSGCQYCGVPLNSELGFNIKQGSNPLYCQKSSNHLHTVSLIYRPFQLYVWDDSQYIPLLVTNKVAELLFGNISAESVYSCYKREKGSQMLVSKIILTTGPPNDAEREHKFAPIKWSRNAKHLYDLVNFAKNLTPTREERPFEVQS